MGATGISWTDETWNPIRGCSRVSEGCRHCYAEVQAARIVRMDRGNGIPEGHGKYDGLVKFVGGEPRWTGTVAFDPRKLVEPLRWRKPRRVFVNSMSDLFHESLTNEQIAAVFGVMAATPQHTFQILTKRARRMREWFEWAEQEAAKVGPGAEVELCVNYADEEGALGERIVVDPRWPLLNVWPGVSVENQAAADERVPLLLRTPAAVRFLSCEPLLGGLYLTPYLAGIATLGVIAADGSLHERPHPPLDWIIAGCESGPGARPCDITWLRSLRDQCAAADVPFFLKQATRLRGSDEHSGDSHRVECGRGSKVKAGDVIELPYLDGEQHVAWPT